MTFEKQGPHNTEAALKLAIEAAREEGIHKIVVASSTGATAKKLAGNRQPFPGAHRGRGCKA